MEWQEIHGRLLDSLRVEVRRHWGRIAEIEAELGLSDGYLNRLCSGRAELKLGLFLRTVETLGLDHGTFLARALDIHPDPEDALIELEQGAGKDHAFDRIVRATRQLEAAEAPAWGRAAAPGTAAAQVVDVAAQKRHEQLRRLRRSRKYRTHAFARAYLDHLDSLRYDEAEEAAKLVTGVAVHLIPALPEPQAGRLELQCRALGVFGSARRSKRRFATAARALRLALEVARRSRLREEAANLLMRASYVLKDFGRFERALALLNEALVIFVRLGSRRDLGRVLVDQGMMSCYLGDYDRAILDLEQALRNLAGTAASLPRYHLAAYQFLAYAFEKLGDLDAAERCLAEGTRAFGTEHAVDRAKLSWSRATLAFRRGAYARAERILRVVGGVLAAKEYPAQEAMVSLDLVAALLAQDKHEEAVELATGMTRLLMSFKNDAFAEAAVVELVSSALEGRLSQRVVGEVRARLEKGGAPATGAPEARRQPLGSIKGPYPGAAAAPAARPAAG